MLFTPSLYAKKGSVGNAEQQFFRRMSQKIIEFSLPYSKRIKKVVVVPFRNIDSVASLHISYSSKKGLRANISAHHNFRHFLL
jgi:hypothetical protein